MHEIESLIGGFTVPTGGFYEILVNACAFIVHDAEVELCFGIAKFRERQPFLAPVGESLVEPLAPFERFRRCESRELFRQPAIGVGPSPAVMMQRPEPLSISRPSPELGRSPFRVIGRDRRLPRSEFGGTC